MRICMAFHPYQLLWNNDAVIIIEDVVSPMENGTAPSEEPIEMVNLTDETNDIPVAQIV